MTSSPFGDPRLRMHPAGGIYALGWVPGHSLRADGQAYLAVDCYEGRCATNVSATTRQENGPADQSVRGWGHAVCECGVLSQHHSNGAARRRWHRAHKARVILGQPEPPGQPAPVAAEAIA